MVDTPQNIMFDVSDYQGLIDFTKLAQVFPNGAVIQIKATQGTTYTSQYFHRNAANALKLKWGVMPYHFCNGDDPQAQWKNFAGFTGLGQGTAYMLDWERYEGVAATVPQMEAMGHFGIATTGRVPMGYWGDPSIGSSPFVPSKFMQTWDWQCPRYRHANDPNFHPDDPRASYNGQVALAAQYTCWGRLAGIENGLGDVDRSVFYADTIADAIAYCQR